MDVPVIYTGSTKHFGKKAKANAVGLYQLDSKKDMNKVLTGLQGRGSNEGHSP